jgi:hypothetical protein
VPEKTFQLPADTIYTICKTISVTRPRPAGWAKGQHNTASHLADESIPSIAESTKKLADAQHEIAEPRAIIQPTREELVACSDQIADAQCELEDQRAITESKDELILDL